MATLRLLPVGGVLFAVQRRGCKEKEVSKIQHESTSQSKPSYADQEMSGMDSLSLISEVVAMIEHLGKLGLDQE